MSDPDAETKPGGSSYQVPEIATVSTTHEPVSDTAPKETNEVFLGGMVVAVICLLLLLLTATFGFFGYRLWQSAKVERTIPSIQELGEQPKVEPVTSTTETAPPTPSAASISEPTPAASTNLASVEVKVLNGGAARGSASTLVERLKQAGYAKATFGNAAAEHTGTVIYYTATAEAIAKVLQETVAKTYPKVTLSPAQAGDKDATVAAVVVVLGK